MKKFKRHFYKASEQKKQIAALKGQKSFEFLKRDVMSATVFPALRENIIDFYYMGMRLCRYESGRMTWHKNATQPNSDSDYENIKNECEGQKTSGKPKERAALSLLYKEYSPYASAGSGLILLDIEVGFPRLAEFGNIQIDLLFLDKDTGSLYFIEAKDADDKRIKVTPYKNESYAALYARLEVKNQIDKYQKNLSARKQEITDAYLNYIDVMQQIFDCRICSANQLRLYPEPMLFVYGKFTENGALCLEALRWKLGDNLIVGDGTASLTYPVVSRHKH